MSREYPEFPRIGIAAVILQNEQVLLVQRGKPPAQGLWGLPGGALELGETVMDGVRREVREETGLDIVVGPLVAVFEPMERDPAGRLRFHYVVLDYLATPVGGTLHAGDDAAAACWTPYDALAALPMLEETRQVIRRAREMK